MSGLASAEYWDDYYRQSPHATFDWYLPNQLTLHRITAQLQSLASTHHLPPHSLHLLQVGCGSSAVATALVEAGYTRLTNIDFSPTCIHSLHTGTAQQYPLTVTFHCMDVRQLTLPSNTFHATIDKGTLDCCALQTHTDTYTSETVLAGTGNTCNTRNSSSAGRMLDEVWRVLRPGGVFMCFSVHGYDARMAMMEETEVEEQVEVESEEGTVEREERKEGGGESEQEAVQRKVGNGSRQRKRREWDVEYHTLAGPLEMPEQQHSYLYICTKWQHDTARQPET